MFNLNGLKMRARLSIAAKREIVSSSENHGYCGNNIGYAELISRGRQGRLGAPHYWLDTLAYYSACLKQIIMIL